MYTKPIIYKAFSIIILVLAVLSAVSSIFSGTVFTSVITKYLPFFDGISFLLITIIIISSLASLFFSYIEFSSMYTFAEMIEYENSNSIYPFTKKSFVFPAKFYKSYGTVIFYIVFFIQAIAIIAAIINASIEKQALLCVPVIPIALSIISILFAYITYYAKFKSFSDLLELVSKKEADQMLKESLKENNPNLLRGYCMFLFIFAIIISILIVISIFLVFGPISSVLGVGGAVGVTVGLIFIGVLSFVSLSIYGCYFDNLAKMLEHHMIIYKMI